MNKNDHKSETGLILLGAAGVLLLLAGNLLKEQFQNLFAYFKLLEGIGIFLVFMAVWNFIQSANFKRNPEAQRKARVDSMDERKLWIRYRSGNNAFLSGIGITYLALLFTGVTTTAISADLAWWVLAGIVVSTMAVYIISMVIYEQRY